MRYRDIRDLNKELQKVYARDTKRRVGLSKHDKEKLEEEQQVRDKAQVTPEQLELRRLLGTRERR